MAETTYEKMTDQELARVVEELERRVAAAGKGPKAGGQGSGPGLSLAEAENELNQARAVLAARKLGQGLP